MASDDIILHFTYSTTEQDTDIRTFRVHQLNGNADGTTTELELYKFYHPIVGPNVGVTAMGYTTFHRLNTSNNNFDTAGAIEWRSNTNATVEFGVDRIPLSELRKAKKTKSKSRRFKANGSEYKWKIAENDTDLFCVDSRGKTIATWTQEQLIFRVDRRVEPILDRLLVTLLLNMWMRQMKRW